MRVNFNEIIINPLDNPRVSNYIISLLEKDRFTRTIPMKRDYCHAINEELYYYLIEHGIPKEDIKFVRGYFKVDNLNLLDKFDLTPSERKLFQKEIGNNFSNINIQKFIKDYLSDIQEEFYYIPHVWLTYDNLIIDNATQMFNRGLEKPISKNNYIENGRG